METTDVARTARAIVAGTWTGAGIVIATNIANAVATFGALGGNRLVGAGVGVAVDVALCVGLIGDRKLSQFKLVSNWGRGLRVTAGVMSLVIGVGASVLLKHYFLALILGFLPILLWLLTEYGQDVLSLFAGRLGAERDTNHQLVAIQQDRDIIAAELTTTRQELERARGDVARVRQDEQRAARQDHDTLSRQVADLTERLATEHGKRVAADARRRTATAATKHRVSRGRSSSTPADRIAWARQKLIDGCDISGADVQQQFPDGPRDGARIVRQARAALATNEPVLTVVGSAR